MTSTIGDSVELQILFCALALGVIQLLLSILFNLAGRGLPWGLSARDEPAKPIGKIGARTERAWHNFVETFALFAGAVLLAHALGKSTPTSVMGAQIYIWARLLYLPFYMFAIPYLRTLAWIASLAGIVMVMAAVWPGM